MTMSLEDRVRALEARVADLEREKTTSASPAPAPASTSAPAFKAPAATQGLSWDKLVDSGEGFLGKAGVSLLVVGFILLFNYAVQQGWLTPVMRIAIGLVVGAGLLVGGTFFFGERRLYRQILIGGGVVILFITALAASELYKLINGPTALLFVGMVAAIAFMLAAHQEEPVIATIGALGALAPPSILLADSVSGTVLWLYLAIIIAWTGGLLALRAWERSLVVTALVSVLAMFHEVPDSLGARIAAVLAITVCWLCFAALPLLRARLAGALAVIPLSTTVLLALPVSVTVGLAFVAREFVFPASPAFEVSAALDAIGFAFIAYWLRPYRTTDASARPVQFRAESFIVDSFLAAVTASLLALGVASITAFDLPWPIVSFAAIALIAGVLGQNGEFSMLRLLSHSLFGALVLLYFLLVEHMGNRPAFDDYAIAFGIVTLMAALMTWRLPRRDERVVYLIALFLVVHIWLATELSAIQSARWLASAAYGVVGSALLITGLSMRQLGVQRAGLISLGLLVARLFLYDLANVNVGVRIVLFMVFGFAFLGLSYLVRSRRFAS